MKSRFQKQYSKIKFDTVSLYYPQAIREYEERIAGCESDAILAEQRRPQGGDKFCPMTLKGVICTEKADACECFLSSAKKIGGLRGLYLHYCYKIGILPKSRQQGCFAATGLIRRSCFIPNPAEQVGVFFGVLG